MYDSIGAFSQETGLSAHTLRYYEKEQLITPKRHANGRRYYTDYDVSWITFIKKLKDTNMPIKEIKQYALLREQGDSTLTERMALLEVHQQRITATIKKWQEHANNLNEKINYYHHAIEEYSKTTQNN